jgi:hypothetical protein
LPKSKRFPFPEIVPKAAMATLLEVHENTVTAMCDDGRLITDHRGRLPLRLNMHFMVRKRYLQDRRPGPELDLCRADIVELHIRELEDINMRLDEMLAVIEVELGAAESKILREKLDKEFREEIPRYSAATLQVRTG